MKKSNVSLAKERFDELHTFGVGWAKKKGLKEEDVERIVHKTRGIKSKLKKQ